MDKVFSKYASDGKSDDGTENGSKILMKTTAPKAAGVILEATHKLKSAQVPGYLKANFEKAWDRFDINSDGYIRAEETHTFMRSLMGKLNKFALAPGSLSDIGATAEKAKASVTQSVAQKKKATTKKAAKKVEKKKPAKKDEDEEPAEDAEKTETEKTEETPAEDTAAQTEEEAPKDEATE